MEFLPTNIGILVHLIAFSLFLGGGIYNMVSGVIMFRNLDRPTFGKVQGTLFPWYFRLLTACSAILLTSMYFAPITTPDASAQCVLLSFCLGCALTQQFAVGPKVTRLMHERQRLQASTSETDKVQLSKISKKFGAWHGVSSTINLLQLISMVLHTIYLSNRIKV